MGLRGRASTGERVVFGEVARLSAALGNSARQSPGRVLGHVLVQPAAIGPGSEDPLDRGVLERAVLEGVRKGFEQVVGVPAFTQSEDLARVVGRGARVALLEGRQKCVRGIAQVLEGAAQLVEVRTALGVSGAVPGEDRVLLRTARFQLVARDAVQVGLVDEELVLGYAHREDFGDVVIG